jgi:predicted ArsR family transcriptional regulator
MQSIKKDYSPQLGSTAERILTRLKTHGTQTSAELGRVLAISSEAVRQQLQRLVREGLVQSRSQTGGVGRPALAWDLTPDGHRRFPDQHAMLAARLLDGIRDALGEAALDKVLALRHEENRKNTLQVMEGSPDLEGRLVQLAGIRTNEGYMCDVQPEGEGVWLLVENHCPIRVAAAACAGFCQSELHLFREVLGAGVAVERIEHMQEGARRCAYRIATSTILAKSAVCGTNAAPSSSACPTDHALSKQPSCHRL